MHLLVDSLIKHFNYFYKLFLFQTSFGYKKFDYLCIFRKTILYSYPAKDHSN